MSPSRILLPRDKENPSSQSDGSNGSDDKFWDCLLVSVFASTWACNAASDLVLLVLVMQRIRCSSNDAPDPTCQKLVQASWPGATCNRPDQTRLFSTNIEPSHVWCGLVCATGACACAENLVLDSCLLAGGRFAPTPDATHYTRKRSSITSPINSRHNQSHIAAGKRDDETRVTATKAKEFAPPKNSQDPKLTECPEVAIVGSNRDIRRLFPQSKCQ